MVAKSLVQGVRAKVAAATAEFGSARACLGAVPGCLRCAQAVARPGTTVPHSAVLGLSCAVPRNLLISHYPG